MIRNGVSILLRATLDRTLSMIYLKIIFVFNILI